MNVDQSRGGRQGAVKVDPDQINSRLASPSAMSVTAERGRCRCVRVPLPSLEGAQGEAGGLGSGRCVSCARGRCHRASSGGAGGAGEWRVPYRGGRTGTVPNKGKAGERPGKIDQREFEEGASGIGAGRA